MLQATLRSVQAATRPDGEVAASNLISAVYLCIPAGGN